MVWGGTVFTAGWIMRIVSTYHSYNLDYYISQYCLIVAGPPIWAACEYNILGRLMHYLPMHAPLHPHRVVIFFVYIGAAVESLTAAGASTIAANKGDLAAIRRGGTLLSIALVLQGAVECLFVFLVVVIHRRCARAHNGKLPRNVRTLCIMLYGTATLVFIRCIARAIEAFSTETTISCNSTCHVLLYHEWYLYVFEAAPMLLYTYWLNIIHPGRLLPEKRQTYLDLDGKTERLGPGWIDRRPRWETFADPLDLVGLIKGQPSHERFWGRPEEWPVVQSKGVPCRRISQTEDNMRRVDDSQTLRGEHKASV